MIHPGNTTTTTNAWLLANIVFKFHPTLPMHAYRGGFHPPLGGYLLPLSVWFAHYTLCPAFEPGVGTMDYTYVGWMG